jgi:hypothetical protein
MAQAMGHEGDNQMAKYMVMNIWVAEKAYFS